MFIALLFRSARPSSPVRRRLALAGLVAVLAVALSCEEASAPQPVSISITPTAATIIVDSLIALSVTDEVGAPVAGGYVEWSSSDPDVASVDSEGGVRGMAPGPAIISGSLGTASDSAAVTVLPAVESVIVTPDRWGMVTGGSVPLTGTFLGPEGDTLESTRHLAWASSDTAVATVDTTGVVTGVGTGAALIIGTAEGRSDTAEVSVAEIEFVSVTAGDDLNCGLTTDGAAYCWGRGPLLGTGYELHSTAPAAVTGGHSFVYVAAGGEHACGLKSDGSVYCWGVGDSGELGQGDTLSSPAPVQVVGGLAFETLSVGRGHTCALTPNGEAYCWGLNYHYALGDSTGEDRTVPTPVYGGHTFAQISAGWRHTCAVADDGEAFCWGWNHHGQLGTGDRDINRIPIPVATDVRFESIGAFQHGHTCGVGTDGLAYCWGHNDFGMLGRGWAGSDELEVGLVHGSIQFTRVDGMDFSTCGASTDGEAYCWGYDTLGNGVFSVLIPVPSRVVHDVGFATIDVGDYSKCGVGRDGIAYCWGIWSGDGTRELRLYPVRVAGQR